MKIIIASKGGRRSFPVFKRKPMGLENFPFCLKINPDMSEQNIVTALAIDFSTGTVFCTAISAKVIAFEFQDEGQSLLFLYPYLQIQMYILYFCE